MAVMMFVVDLASDGLRALVTRADRLSTRHTAVLEGAFGSSIRPGTLTRECFQATLGRTEHGVGDLTTGISDSEVETGSGCSDHDLMAVDVAIIQGQGSSCNHLQPGNWLTSGETPHDHRSTALVN